MTRVLGWLAALGLLAGVAAGFGYAPREAIQGNVQRIMYLHVPSVLTAYLAFGLVLLGSIADLATRRPGWDRLAASAAESGVLFTAITIVSGSMGEGSGPRIVDGWCRARHHFTEKCTIGMLTAPRMPTTAA